MNLHLTDDPDPAIRAAVLVPLDAHNTLQTGSDERARPLCIRLRDASGAVCGGLYGLSYWGWLHVELVFLPTHLRATGLGTRLMQVAEAEAVRRGCRGMWLTTHSYQARPFYERLGFTLFATLDDHPRGHQRFWMGKSNLVAAVSTAGMDMTETPDPGDRDRIRDGLLADMATRVGPASNRPLAVLVRDEAGSILGGLYGRTGRDWLFVELFGLPPQARRRGLGTRILRMAEDEARARGCLGSWLDTFSFQARPFYERLGYRLLGRIDDYPPPFSRFFLARRLD